jgi:hypothetical protein
VVNVIGRCPTAIVNKGNNLSVSHSPEARAALTPLTPELAAPLQAHPPHLTSNEFVWHIRRPPEKVVSGRRSINIVNKEITSSASLHSLENRAAYAQLNREPAKLLQVHPFHLTSNELVQRIRKPPDKVVHEWLQTEAIQTIKRRAGCTFTPGLI